MSDNIISPNMGLVIPLVGQEAGPQYSQDINTSLSTVDAHDHTPGNGVQITPSGMNINGNLDFNTNNINNLRSARFTSQVSPLTAVSPDINNVYVSGVDLYYNDGSGNQVRITQGGGIAGSPGSITGLASPASASYNSGTGTFIWQQDTNKAANMDMASLIIRKDTISSPGITISAPSGLSGNYDIALPATLPASQKFVTLDNSGNLAADWAVDNSTLEVSGNSVRVKNQGITDAKILDHTITIDKLAIMATGTTVGVGGIAVSASCGSFQTTGSRTAITNLSVTITTAGRPVRVCLIPDGDVTNGQGAQYFIDKASGTDVPVQSQIFLVRDGVSISSISNGPLIPGVDRLYMGLNTELLTDQVAAGTYTYTVDSLVLYNNASSTYNVGIYNWKLQAYEI